MATADEYAAWIVKNADKKGTPQFETVAQAYKLSRATAPPAAASTAAPAPEATLEPMPDAVKPPSKDYMAGRAPDRAGVARSLASVLNGPLMGFGDEIAGGIGAVIDKAKNPLTSLADNYRANRDTVRGMQDQEREEYPWTTGITQAMASAPLMAVGKAVGAVRGALPQVFRASRVAPTVSGMGTQAAAAAGTGAAYGAVAGAGNSTSSTAGDLLGDSARSAAVSSALGGIASPVAAAVGAVSGNVGQRLSQTSAAEYAKQKIAEALARDARGTQFTGGYSNPISQIAARFGKLGDEAVMADAGGRNTNQLLDTLATLPGRTKDAVFNVQRQRTAGVGGRMRDAAEEALGTGGQRLPSTVDSLIAQRMAASAPLYNQLRNTTIQPSPALVKMMEAADELGVTKLGREMATARQQPFTMQTANPRDWNMGDMDHIKQGIDQVLSSRKAMNADSTLTPLGHSYQTLKTRMVGELDTATTDAQTGGSLYRSARAAYEGPSRLIDAANAGKLAINRDENSILSTMKSMDPNDLQAFRIGAFEGLRAKLGTQGGQTNIMNMWKEPATQEKLRAIFGNQRAYRDFASSVAGEAQLKRLQSVGVGSQTAARNAGMGDLDAPAMADAAGAVGALKTGNPLAALGSISKAWNRVSTPQSVRDEMGALLLSRGPQSQASLNSLVNLVQRINDQNLLLNGGVGALGGQVGTRLVNPLMTPVPLSQ